MDYAQEVAHRATLTIGTMVREYDDDGADNPITWGIIVEPTTAEMAEPVAADAEVVVMVQWSPHYRRWEYAEDLRAR